MATEENKEDSKLDLPIAIRHSVLEDITKQLDGMELSATAEVAGHKYFMTTLTADEELWTDGIYQSNSPVQAVSSFRLTRLAASIKKIDDVDVSELFDFPEDMGKSDREQYTGSKYSKRTWEMGQLYIWLGDLPTPVTDDISKTYREISKKRREALEALKKPQKEISGGELKVMSSPVKESSSATQM